MVLKRERPIFKMVLFGGANDDATRATARTIWRARPGSLLTFHEQNSQVYVGQESELWAGEPKIVSARYGQILMSPGGTKTAMLKEHRKEVTEWILRQVA
jgi:hypothetical protein